MEKKIRLEPRVCGAGRDSTASDAKPIKIFIPFADGTLHHRKSSPVVRSPIGAFVVELSTEQWLWWYFATRSSIGTSPKHLPQPSSTPKYRSHSGLCMTEKLPTGVLIDCVVIPCSNDQNSLSNISQYHQCCDFGPPQPESATNIARTADFV